jgi:glycosyltransferase involved in cell wall biosynthesis
VLDLLWHNVGLYRQFRAVGGRLVHANDLNVLPAAFLLARYWHAAVVYDSHELWTECNPSWSPLRRRLLALLERVLIRRAEAVVTVNRAIARELATRYGIAQPLVVMNCPPMPKLLSRPAVYNTPPKLRALYLGMLNEGRGLIELVDAAALVPELELTICGPGPMTQSIAEQIERHGLADRVHLLPPVPVTDVIDTLAHYHVGVIPYPRGTLNVELSSPIKLFEYMAAGLAVVASDLPVIREVVTEAGCGMLVEPGDVASLAAGLRRLAQDQEALTAFRRNSLQAARERYNAAAEEQKLLSTYQVLLTSQSRF